MTAEFRIAYVRAAVILLNVVTFLLLDTADSILWLGYAVSVVALAYAAFAVHRAGRVTAPSWANATTAADATLVALWIAATGGYESPYVVVLYASIAAVGFRYSTTVTVLVAVGYGAMYVGMLGILGEFAGHALDTTIRAAYVVFVGAIVGLIGDETESEMGRAAGLRERALLAEAAEARLEAATDAAREAILMVDRQDRVAHASAGTLAVLGRPVQAVQGVRVDQVVPGIGALLRGGAPRSAEAHPRPVLLDLGDATGGPRAVEVVIARPVGGEGALRTVVVRDASHRSEAESSARARAQELERSNSDLERFAHTAAHDMRSPLMVVAGIFDELGERYKGRLDETADVYLEEGKATLERLRRTLDGVLEFARAGSTNAPIEPTSAAAALRAALANLRSEVERTGGVVESGPMPEVVADGTQLTLVFQNLIGNALKFHGAAKPRVKILASRVDGYVRFEVRDEGLGIPEADQASIFEMFQRAHGSDVPGTGIGLSTCRRIVERHHGRIGVESRPGEGSTFWFTIPAVTTGPRSQIATASPVERRAAEVI